MKIQGTN